MRLTLSVRGTIRSAIFKKIIYYNDTGPTIFDCDSSGAYINYMQILND